MPDRLILPDWLAHVPAPGARSFALLAGIEAMVRGVLVSVMPLAMYAAFPDAGLVSRLYLAAGVVSLVAGLLVPWGTRRLPRRWMFTAGALVFVAGNLFALAGGPLVALAVVCNMVATVIVTVCFNAYLLDYIARTALPRAESLRLLYTGLAWTAGPVVGVSLHALWPPAPFLLSSAMALLLIAVFWVFRLGNGRAIARARAPAPSPLAYLGRFLAQPRLVAGWVFVTLRSCGWWAFIVYLPIYAVDAGLGTRIGGVSLSIASALLFLAPWMQRMMAGRPVRTAVRAGFLAAALLFLAAAAAAPWPWVAVALLLGASFFLVFLDIFGGLPFLMAVKPSERAEMTAVYSSFRDASNVLTPAVAALVLLVAPVPAIFAVTGTALAGAFLLAGTVHPRLGLTRGRGGLAPAR